MMSLGSLGFAAPWILLGFAVLPILWWLLRVTPPAPKRVVFPALRLLRDLVPREETPARTPPWLVLMRMLLAALVIVALAHPLLNPSATLAGAGPLVIAVDDGWGAADRWPERQTLLTQLVDQAQRESRRVVLFGTAPAPGGVAAPALSILRAEDARAAVNELGPKPWPVDRKAALDRLRGLALESASIAWLSDGIDGGDATPFADALAKLGDLRVVLDQPAELPRLLTPGDSEAKDLTMVVRRASPEGEDRFTVRAVADDGRLLARTEEGMAPGTTLATVSLKMPVELRNRATSVLIEGETSAGATLLLDERWRRRPVGVAAPPPGEAAQPLLSGAYYLERALQPFSEVRRASVGQLVQHETAAILLPDATTLDASDRAALVKWMGAGGLVMRFAGQNLAENGDELLPVTLRRGGRVLGGALSWEKPAHLAPFDADSPFAGLSIPDDVTVTRQVLAEPSLDLSSKTWARLTDGTPLVTAEKRGKGWLVLVHTTADPAWSSLPISGLFVDMLRRVVGLSQGVANASDAPLPPVETLDGFGRLGAAPASAQLIAAGAFKDTRVDARHPPGFYGTTDTRRALNLAGAVAAFEAITQLPPGIATQAYERAKEVDFRPWLLGVALGLALVDLVVAYALRGLLGGIGRWRVSGAATGVLLLIALGAFPARAAGDDDWTIRATSEFHLAFVRSGIPEVDDQTRAGLAGLSDVLNRRTAVEAAVPLDVDIETDEIVFFPLLYWPVAEGQQLPSAKAIDK
ncbi:MAG TPA: BatA domain-containing protein, partial [Stellaceae bacterium]|nr:BatA domain-containing protein [Stellaceae bacterium]